MKEITISQGYKVIVDDKDFQLANSYKWSVDKRNKTNYAKGWDNINKKIIYLHRLITGVTDRHILIDHKDRNGLNNTRENLRFSTHSLNQVNRPKNKENTTGYKGVTKRKDCNKYQAYIIVNRKGVHLGLYNTPEEASKAYNNAVEKYFGKEYSSL